MTNTIEKRFFKSLAQQAHKPSVWARILQQAKLSVSSTKTAIKIIQGKHVHKQAVKSLHRELEHAKTVTNSKVGLLILSLLSLITLLYTGWIVQKNHIIQTLEMFLRQVTELINRVSVSTLWDLKSSMDDLITKIQDMKPTIKAILGSTEVDKFFIALQAANKIANDDNMYEHWKSMQENVTEAENNLINAKQNLEDAQNTISTFQSYINSKNEQELLKLTKDKVGLADRNGPNDETDEIGARRLIENHTQSELYKNFDREPEQYAHAYAEWLTSTIQSKEKILDEIKEENNTTDNGITPGMLALEIDYMRKEKERIDTYIELKHKEAEKNNLSNEINDKKREIDTLTEAERLDQIDLKTTVEPIDQKILELKSAGATIAKVSERIRTYGMWPLLFKHFIQGLYDRVRTSK